MGTEPSYMAPREPPNVWVCPFQRTTVNRAGWRALLGSLDWIFLFLGPGILIKVCNSNTLGDSHSCFTYSWPAALGSWPVSQTHSHVHSVSFP